MNDQINEQLQIIASQINFNDKRVFIGSDYFIFKM